MSRAVKRRVSRPVTSKYDDLFVKYAGAIAPAFLKEVSRRESGLDPTQAAESTKYPGTDVARGLLQITKITLADFNANHGTSYTWDDMFVPEINVQVGAASANNIVKAYAASRVPGLRPDWNDQRWVALFIYGWSAGYSAKAGVIYVARDLTTTGDPVTVETVQQRAIDLPKAHGQLRRPKKVTWALNGARLYFSRSQDYQDFGKLGSVGRAEVETSAINSTQALDRSTVMQNQRGADFKRAQATYYGNASQSVAAVQSQVYAAMASAQGKPPEVENPMAFNFTTGLWTDGKAV